VLDQEATTPKQPKRKESGTERAQKKISGKETRSLEKQRDKTGKDAADSHQKQNAN